jgi:fumarate hydratase class I
MSEKPTTRLTLPLSEDEVKNLHTGDFVLLSGSWSRPETRPINGCRYLHPRNRSPSNEDARVEKALASALKGGGIYHCGPVVSRQADEKLPLFSRRTNHQHTRRTLPGGDHHQYGVRVIIGKGGMGEKTLQACREASALYLTPRAERQYSWLPA